MSGRGRGRGRGFGRGKPFPNNDQLNLLPPEKPLSQHSSPYPPLDYFPAILSVPKDYEDVHMIKDQLSSYFQSSSYHLKVEDENAKLFSSQGEATVTKKTLLHFDWDLFPLELRPTGKRKLKSGEEILANLRKNKNVRVDLTWLDKLEEKEKVDVVGGTVDDDEVTVKKELPENRNEEEENEEFDDEELDLDNDYNTNYFDNGDDYLDEDNDADEGPCY